MKRFSIGRPSPALIVGIIALVVATAGTSVAAIQLGELSKGAKIKTFGAGKLRYVPATVALPAQPAVDPANPNPPAPPRPTTVVAPCPDRYHAVGGGVQTSDPANVFVAEDGPIDTADGDGVPDDAWRAEGVVNGDDVNQSATVIAICARSKRVR